MKADLPLPVSVLTLINMVGFPVLALADAWTGCGAEMFALVEAEVLCVATSSDGGTMMARRKKERSNKGSSFKRARPSSRSLPSQKECGAPIEFFSHSHRCHPFRSLTTHNPRHRYRGFRPFRVGFAISGHSRRAKHQPNPRTHRYTLPILKRSGC